MSFFHHSHLHRPLLPTLPLLAVFLLSLFPVSIHALRGLSYNDQALTPPMGWDTYNAYDLHYNSTTITTNADLLIRLGFRDLGYRVVIFDDAMTELQRSPPPSNKLIENHAKFPEGLANLVRDTIHGQGLEFGVYSSAGAFTCGGYPGSLGFEEIDAKWWVEELGADYLKYDNCFNRGLSGSPWISSQRYAAMSDALIKVTSTAAAAAAEVAGGDNTTNVRGKNITFSLCNWGDDKPWEWASTISNSARITGDIAAIYSSFDPVPSSTTTCPCGPDEYSCQLPGYGCSIMNILGKASYVTSKNFPGYWNDLDMLEVGNGDSLTYDEAKTHFSMWAAIKSPLIMGNMLDRMAWQDYGILINPAVLAVSQDEKGSAIRRRILDRGGVLGAESCVCDGDTEILDKKEEVLVEIEVNKVTKDKYGFGELQVWSGDLQGGDQVVAFLNAGDKPTNMTYTLIEALGILSSDAKASKDWNVYDLWGEETVIPETSANLVLSGNVSIADVDGGKWYWNASQISWAEGVARRERLLLGTHVGTVKRGGSLSAVVPRHGIAMWRLVEVVVVGGEAHGILRTEL